MADKKKPDPDAADAESSDTDITPPPPTDPAPKSQDTTGLSAAHVSDNKDGATSNETGTPGNLDDESEIQTLIDPERADPEPPSETDPEPPSETETETARAVPQPQPAVERVIVKRGGFLPALIGGVLAAILGFVLARAELLDPILPAALKPADHSTAIAALQGKLSEQGDALAALRADLSAIDIPDIPALAAKLDGLSGQVDSLRAETGASDQRVEDLAARVGKLDARLSALEKRPITETVPQEAIAAYEQEVANLRAEVESMLSDAKAREDEARQLQANAADSAQRAANRVSVAQLRSAIDGGTPYAGSVETLSAAGVSVPEPLAETAETGVATHADLLRSYPAAARVALAAARSAGAGDAKGLVAFFQRQFGARSVSPREGDDPDAILSRAEAALVSGNLSLALDEIANLPEPARRAMDDWIARAQQRLAALAAVQDLSERLNTN